MAYDKPEKTTPVHYQWIVDQIADDATVMESDNGQWLWLRVSRSGHSFSHRLPAKPEAHHLDDARKHFAAWWNDEKSPDDMLDEVLSKKGE